MIESLSTVDLLNFRNLESRAAVTGHEIAKPLKNNGLCFSYDVLKTVAFQ